jgi:hypothetical protein
MELTEFFTTIKTPMTIVHVISVIFGMGSALVSDILFTFYSKDKKLSPTEIKTLRLLSNTVWIGLIVISLSGTGLFLSDIPKYLHSVKFLSKMSVLAVLLVNGFILHKYVWKHVISRNFLVNTRESIMRKVAFACGSISVISWVTVCALGVLDRIAISYGIFMAGYAVVILGGIVTALFMEYKEFEK